jgi:tripartite-type tricarboxylate transporter receptor subunit TctC
MRKWMTACIAATGLSLTTTAYAQSDPIEAFYKGKTVEMVIGSTPGGGYDLYGRLIARYIGKHIPGNPNVIVRNMPGAGSMVMTNWLYNVAPRDGTVIAVAPQVVAIEQALGSDGIQYDARKFNFIGRAAEVVEVTYTWHTSATKTLEDARRRETVMGASGTLSPTYFYLKALNELAGTKFQIVNGYPGGGETELAMQRGEVEGGSKAWASMKVDNAPWLRDKMVNVIVQYALQRSADLPDVPLMMELGRTDSDRKALGLFAMGNAMGRSIFASPGIPAERVKALRKAFDMTVQDPEFLTFVRDKNIDVGPPMGGEQLQKLTDETLAVTPEVVALAKKARGS